MSTPYHAKYFAQELSRHHQAGTVAKLSHTLFDACIDLNPHQIDAALFALRSPLSKGAILADEVGLGKTIEAGLLLCQYWAERKRRLLVICPAALRKQWSIELIEKFNLPNTIIDAIVFDQILKDGKANPFDVETIVITSIHFASRNHVKLRTISWDLVVIDEAHKLRNVFRPNNKMANNIKWALGESKKILLTATPLQNSLMELYGLSSMIDEHIFGSADVFRNQFALKNTDHEELGKRLHNFCRRTLRSQVSEYISYTQRHTITVPYEPAEIEQSLYRQISEFLQGDDTYSIPHGQKHLMLLILRKLLASSSYAISGTLEIMRSRLQNMKNGEDSIDIPLIQKIVQAEEIEEEIVDESEDWNKAEPADREIDMQRLDAEIAQLTNLIDCAHNIQYDTKLQTLLHALNIGFEELQRMGATRKAVIFTESRRTQDYIFRYLEGHGYKEQIVLFNGTNTEEISKRIYEQWTRENEKTGRMTGSKAIDLRNSLIEYFRDHATIMIATEAAAEGINLQFCSFVINYDLPWNPQRIEQRIGRCHRYGQKFDVVVLNFLNQSNETDYRVYELLNEKFHLFAGVFGASDEVLGNIESGLDFENKILDIYQQCRTQEETLIAFEKLRNEMDDVIQNKMLHTRQILLEHFDQDVHTRFRNQLSTAREQLDKYSVYFWEVSKFVLSEIARFDEQTYQFDLYRSPMANIKTGRYHLVSKRKPNQPGEFLYRLTHPLGEYVIAAALANEVRPAHVYFDISNHPTKISTILNLKGQSGWLAMHVLNISSFEQEDYILFTAFTDKGKSIDSDICEKFFYCRSAVASLPLIPEDIKKKIEHLTALQEKTTLEKSIEMNNSYFIEECEKLDEWADDLVDTVEKQLKANKEQKKILNRQALLSGDLYQHHDLQLQIKNLEEQKKQLRVKLFKVEDEISMMRDSLIEKLGKRMHHDRRLEHLFTIRWSVI